MFLEGNFIFIFLFFVKMPTRKKTSSRITPNQSKRNGRTRKSALKRKTLGGGGNNTLFDISNAWNCFGRRSIITEEDKNKYDKIQEKFCRKRFVDIVDIKDMYKLLIADQLNELSEQNDKIKMINCVEDKLDYFIATINERKQNSSETKKTKQRPHSMFLESLRRFKKANNTKETSI